MPEYSPWLPEGDSVAIDYPVAYPDLFYERDMSRIMGAVERDFLAMQEKVISTPKPPVIIKAKNPSYPKYLVPQRGVEI